MPNATGAHRGTAPDADWSYALEAHIAWSAAGSPSSALTASAPSGGVCEITYDMSAICGHSLTLGPQATKALGKGALKNKTGTDTYEFRNLPSNVSSAAAALTLWKSLLSDVEGGVSSACSNQGVSASPSSVFMSTMTGAHTDVCSIEHPKCITWGAKHNNGKGRWGSMSDAAKSVIAHTNLPCAQVAMTAFQNWMTQSTAVGANAPAGAPSSSSTLTPKQRNKFQNARFDPIIFLHAFNLKGTFYDSFCDYVEARTVGINGWVVDCENKTTANTTGHVNLIGVNAVTTNLVGVNKQAVRARMPDPNGKTIYIEELNATTGDYVIRFKLSFRIIKKDGTVDQNARPATIIPEWSTKPEGLSMTESQWNKLGNVLLREFRDTYDTDVVEEIEQNAEDQEIIELISNTNIQEFLDQGVFVPGYTDPSGNDKLEGAVSESRWLKLAGLLQG